MKLYEIANEYQQALTTLHSIDEITQDVISDTLSIIKDDFETKAVAVSSFVKNIEADILAMKEAEASIAKRRKALQNQIESVKSYLLDNMERTGINHIHSPYFDIKLKKCPSSVEIIDEELIPDECFRVKREVSKSFIKDALKNGVIIEGAKLIDDKMRIDIK